jgi:Tol biopolymer transport system component
MKRLYAIGVALALVLVAPASAAEAHPRHDRGAIVYISDRASVSADDPIDEIYALDPYTRQVDRLTYDVPGVERWPTISPDGRSLAWVRWGVDDTGALRPDLSELYRCDLRFRAGSWLCRKPRKLVGPIFEARIAWTPDSRRLLYSGPQNAEGDVDLYSVNVRSGRVRNLTNEAVDGAFAQHSWPTVSPDGRFIVYARGALGSNGADLYRRNIDGSHPVQLTAAPFNDIAPDFSPDGQRLVFHSNRDGDADIYIMDAAAEGPDNPALNLTDALRAPVTDPDSPPGPSQERAPSFSPDGRQIAFMWFTIPDNGYSDGEIYTMRSDGSHVRNLTDNNPTDPAALTVGDIQPDWGPSPTRNHHS